MWWVLPTGKDTGREKELGLQGCKRSDWSRYSVPKACSNSAQFTFSLDSEHEILSSNFSRSSNTSDSFFLSESALDIFLRASSRKTSVSLVWTIASSATTPLRLSSASLVSDCSPAEIPDGGFLILVCDIFCDTSNLTSAVVEIYGRHLTRKREYRADSRLAPTERPIFFKKIPRASHLTQNVVFQQPEGGISSWSWRGTCTDANSVFKFWNLLSLGSIQVNAPHLIICTQSLKQVQSGKALREDSGQQAIGGTEESESVTKHYRAKRKRCGLCTKKSSEYGLCIGKHSSEPRDKLRAVQRCFQHRSREK